MFGFLFWEGVCKHKHKILETLQKINTQGQKTEPTRATQTPGKVRLEPTEVLLERWGE
jgi:hypothetical protein